VTITFTATRPADGSAIARPRVDAMARCGKGVNKRAGVSARFAGLSAGVTPGGDMLKGGV